MAHTALIVLKHSHIDTIKKELLDTIDHITRVINSYDIYESVTYI